MKLIIHNFISDFQRETPPPSSGTQRLELWTRSWSRWTRTETSSSKFESGIRKKKINLFVCSCGFKAHQCLGQRYGLKTLSTTGKPPFLTKLGSALTNAWASGTVLRPFLQPESPLSSRSWVSGFKCKLRDSDSRPQCPRPRALTTRLYTIHTTFFT